MFSGGLLHITPRLLGAVFYLQGPEITHFWVLLWWKGSVTPVIQVAVCGNCCWLERNQVS